VSNTTTTRTQELADFFEAQVYELEGLLRSIDIDANLAYEQGHQEWLGYDLKEYRKQLGATLGTARYFRSIYDLKARKERGEA
jgi:hypothetical protein